jgi:hypothetical protein
VRIETATGPQVRQLVLARGYLATSEPVLHFGLGPDRVINRLTVTWPSGHRQEFTGLAADQHLTITEPDDPAPPLANTPAPPRQYVEIGPATGLALRVGDDPLDELARQPLLPVRQNRRGPALALGDFTGDGLDDAVIGGTPRDPARLLRATATGRFESDATAGLQAGVNVRDGPVLLFDADGDATTDLLLTRGGTRMPAHAPDYQPRLFLNPGHRGLCPAPADALPALPISTGALAAADFDRDGRLDVFLGGRTQPGDYPLPPATALLRNTGGGRFADVTATLAPGLERVGLVTSALWTDVDDDGWPDLLLALEWGTIRCWRNREGRGFEDATERLGFAAAGHGWWNSLAAADFNGDGRLDYAAGNLGLNTPYQASPDAPALLYRGDFKGSGAIRLLEGYYEGDRLLPRRNRRQLGAQLPAILRKFPSFDSYAKTTLGKLVDPAKLAAARVFQATEFRSGVFLSQPEGNYRFEPLPAAAQLAPMHGLAAGDFDGDGHADIVAVQNCYAPIPYYGRFDGGIGIVLAGDGRGHWRCRGPAETGFIVRGDAEALAVLDLGHDGWPDFLVSRHDDRTLAFRNLGSAGRRSLGVRLQGRPGNPTAIGARIAVELADGTQQVAEVQAGSGYFTQSSALAFFGSPVGNHARRVSVRWPDGSRSEAVVPDKAGLLELRQP